MLIKITLGWNVAIPTTRGPDETVVVSEVVVIAKFSRFGYADNM